MFVACMSLITREGEVGVVGMTDEVAMGYYLVKWLSEPYTLQVDTAGMSGMIPPSWWPTRCTSTGYSTYHTGTHRPV
jgi:hypothetical protein